ncbi:MAG: hypothetical protein HY666_05065 [Chloroflexi bacterium]|nr:hypothetical protein [Chloroflexota bacterium]
MDGVALLEKARTAGLKVWSQGDKLVIRGPKAAEPLALRLIERKPEIMAALRKPRLKEGPHLWHAKEVESLVLKEGYCIFWSDLFQEPVAFILDKSFRSKVPANIVCYDTQEISLLFPGDGGEVNDRGLRLLHQAKKHGGGRVTDVTRQEE